MIIDFHAHLFPDKIAKKTIELLSQKADIPAHTDGTREGLLHGMEKGGVEIAVNLPVLTNPKSFDKVNAFAKELNESAFENGRRIISFAGIHPACEKIPEKMKWIRENGFLGVKLHPDYQETYFDDAGYLEILREAEKQDLIVLTHAGVDIGYRGCPVRCTPERALSVIRKIPYEKLVLAHLGAAEMPDEVYERLCGQKVWFDTAYVLRFVTKEQFLRILDKHGEDQMLFGSDSPWSDIAGDVKILKSFGLNRETEEKIFCENAKKLLGLQ